MNENPLLKGKVPASLVALGTLRPFMVSSLGIAFDNHRFGYSVAISFRADNMVVSSRYHEVKLKQAFGYKFNPGRLITRGSTLWKMSVELDSMIRQVHPHIKYPQCFAHLLRRMRTSYVNESVELLLVHHVSLLSTPDYIKFTGETNFLVRKKLPLYRVDPKVKKMLDRLHHKVAKLVGYDNLPWLMTIFKHNFLLSCYDYSEWLRNSRTPKFADGEAVLRYYVKRGMISKRTNGALAAAYKTAFIESVPTIRKLAVNQIALHRDVIEHLIEMIEVLKECFPFSREDAAEAVRALLPMLAVVIQDELSRFGLFNTEMKMTTYRSVSPHSIRCGVFLPTDRVLVFMGLPPPPAKKRKQKKEEEKNQQVNQTLLIKMER